MACTIYICVCVCVCVFKYNFPYNFNFYQHQDVYLYHLPTCHLGDEKARMIIHSTIK